MLTVPLVTQMILKEMYRGALLAPSTSLFTMDKIRLALTNARMGPLCVIRIYAVHAKHLAKLVQVPALARLAIPHQISLCCGLTNVSTLVRLGSPRLDLTV